jgi:hypothetical protein
VTEYEGRGKSESSFDVHQELARSAA